MYPIQVEFAPKHASVFHQSGVLYVTSSLRLKFLCKKCVIAIKCPCGAAATHELLGVGYVFCDVLLHRSSDKI